MLPQPLLARALMASMLLQSQDTAKSTHYETEGLPDHERTFVDLNRAGTGLMEIVSGPEMR